MSACDRPRLCLVATCTSARFAAATSTVSAGSWCNVAAAPVLTTQASACPRGWQTQAKAPKGTHSSAYFLAIIMNKVGLHAQQLVMLTHAQGLYPSRGRASTIALWHPVSATCSAGAPNWRALTMHSACSSRSKFCLLTPFLLRHVKRSPAKVACRDFGWLLAVLHAAPHHRERLQPPHPAPLLAGCFEYLEAALLPAPAPAAAGASAVSDGPCKSLIGHEPRWPLVQLHVSHAWSAALLRLEPHA